MAECEINGWEEAAADKRAVYEGFVSLIKYGSIAIALLLTLMAIFLT